MFRVIIAGSRDFTDLEYASGILSKAFANRQPDSIVCGMARGADTVGMIWAAKHGIKVDKFPADWEKRGRAAGYYRNREMAENAEALVAFWDGESRGTKHMITIAIELGLKVIVCNYRENRLYKMG